MRLLHTFFITSVCLQKGTPLLCLCKVGSLLRPSSAVRLYRCINKDLPIKPLFRSLLLIGAVLTGLTYTVWALDTQAPVQHPQHKQSTDDSDLFANADS